MNLTLLATYSSKSAKELLSYSAHVKRAESVARDPCQVTAQNVDGESSGHEECAYPEAPVVVHPLPVRSGARFPMFAAFSFVIVPISGHISPPSSFVVLATAAVWEYFG
jgi:hypothetical protein